MACRVLLAIIILIISLSGWVQATPLSRLSANPRYFTDDGSRAVYLTGSQAHNAMVDFWNSGATRVNFDYPAYLNFLQANNHNLLKFWPSETSQVNTGTLLYNDPLPYQCVSGTPPACTSYNLSPPYNSTYFTRLAQRVSDAQARGIYVIIMLFDGWSIQNWPGTQAWNYHPYKLSNNVNSINGDPNGDGYGIEIFQSCPSCTNPNSALFTLQKNYVQHVIDTVNDYDNVLYEIANEAQLNSAQWQYDMINYIHTYEATKPKQHPVGMTTVANEATILGGFQQGTYSVLANSPADWISAGHGSPDGLDWMTIIPPAGGDKVHILDTDHIWGAGGTVSWVWKTFTRGMGPLYGDFGDLPITGADNCCPMTGDPSTNVRTAMGQTRTYANRITLAQMIPHGDLCSSGYCLARPGQEYLVFLPSGGSVDLNLLGGAASFSVEWFNVGTGATTTAANVSAANPRTLTAPFGGSAVVYLVGITVPGGGGMEQRCAELGVNCVCSEPLNTTVLSYFFSTYYNPGDSATKECTVDFGQSTGLAIKRLQNDLTGTNNALILGRLPNRQSALQYVLLTPTQFDATISGELSLGNMQAISYRPNLEAATPGTVNGIYISKARMAFRYYVYYSDDFDFTGGNGGACTNAKRSHADTINLVHGFEALPTISTYNYNNWISDAACAAVGMPQYCSAFKYNNGAQLEGDCCQFGPTTSANEQAPLTAAEYRGKWFLIESIISNRFGVGWRLVTYWRNITDNGREIKIIDSNGSYGGGGGGVVWVPSPTLVSKDLDIEGQPPVFKAEGKIYGYRAGVCRGFNAYSHFMMAQWDTDTGQRIGAAYEVEGGSGQPPDTTPPAPPTGVKAE